MPALKRVIRAETLSRSAKVLPPPHKCGGSDHSRQNGLRGSRNPIQAGLARNHRPVGRPASNRQLLSRWLLAVFPNERESDSALVEVQDVLIGIAVIHVQVSVANT